MNAQDMISERAALRKAAAIEGLRAERAQELRGKADEIDLALAKMTGAELLPAIEHAFRDRHDDCDFLFAIRGGTAQLRQ